MSLVNNNPKPLELNGNFTKGERSYLREQGITEREFNKLGNVAREEWKDECKNPAYETMRNYGKKITKIFV